MGMQNPNQQTLQQFQNAQTALSGSAAEGSQQPAVPGPVTDPYRLLDPFDPSRDTLFVGKDGVHVMDPPGQGQQSQWDAFITPQQTQQPQVTQQQQYQQVPQQTQQPQAPQPSVDDLLSFLANPQQPAQTQQDPAITLLQEQNRQLQALVQQALAGRQTSNEPDYLNMSAADLHRAAFGDEDEGIPGNLQGILKSVVAQAETRAKSSLEQKITEQEGMMKALLKQHNQTQAQNSVQALKAKYGTDPLFAANLQAMAGMIVQPVWQQVMASGDPSAFETAYSIASANNMRNPQYQQMIANAALQNQYQANLQKMQAGTAPAAVSGTYQNVHTLRNNAMMPTGASDQAVLAEILSAGQAPGMSPIMQI